MKFSFKDLWIVLIGGAALAAYFYWLDRNSPGGKAAINAGQSKPNFEQSPAQDVKDQTQLAIDRATQAAQAIRKDPGIAALLGLGQPEIDRITLSPNAYAGIYQRVPYDNGAGTAAVDSVFKNYLKPS